MRHSNSSKFDSETKIKVFGDVTFYYDVKSEFVKDLICKTIRTNGYAPEHNYEYFISHTSHEMRPVFVYFGKNIGIFGIEWDDNCYQVLSEIIAKEENQSEIATKFFDIVLNQIKAKKILVEFSPNLRKELLKSLKKNNSNIKLGTPLCKYYSPLINVKKWDKELFGSKFSNLRKAKNRFFRNFKIEVLKGNDVLEIPFEELNALVNSWKKNRKSTDRAFVEYYIDFFKNKFQGSACSLALKINGELKGVASGITIPNTNEKNVYYVVNLHDYSIQELGDFLTLLFLDELKDKGFEYMDFGSSDENLLNYKKKFGIESQYEILVYYVKLKKDKI